jgi:F-type H+-transporting ATPase subunit b
LETYSRCKEREEGIKTHYFLLKMQEKKNPQADNQRILQEARMERDNMLKDAREIKEKMIADSKVARSENDRTQRQQLKVKKCSYG